MHYGTGSHRQLQTSSRAAVDLSCWFRQRVGDIKGRLRRVAIVALARKLMVALWRYLETGVVPTGAVLRPSL